MNKLSLLALAALFCFSASARADTFDRAAWIADFEQMKVAITEQSPNLDWAVERGLDLPAMETRARTRLSAANDDAAARSALERFVRNFADGHMELHWPSAPTPASADPPAPRSTCAELGYRSDDESGAIATRLPGYEALSPPNAYVAAGIAPVGHRRLGVLRIPLFAPNHAICARVLVERGMPPDAPCDERCGDAVSRRADALFLDEIAERIRALTARRPHALLVDVAANGGGNDSAIAIARMLAGRDIPSPAMALLRSPAQAQDLAEDSAALEAGLDDASPAERQLLQGLIAQLVQARTEALQPCNRSALWTGAAVACSQILRGPFFAGGFISGALPAESVAKPWAEYVSSTARLQFTSGLWTGPLMVLVDGNSASSTELFGAMLQDSGRALIVGSPTFGAGCGWVLPHEDVVLRHSGGRLSIPNCARFRRDGSNELDGLQPDVLVGLRTYDSPTQRMERLHSRLPAALDAALRMRRR